MPNYNLVLTTEIRDMFADYLNFQHCLCTQSYHEIITEHGIYRVTKQGIHSLNILENVIDSVSFASRGCTWNFDNSKTVWDPCDCIVGVPKFRHYVTERIYKVHGISGLRMVIRESENILFDIYICSSSSDSDQLRVTLGSFFDILNIHEI